MKNDLLKLAFEYRKTKLWTKMWDNDVFALELEDGTIAYISIMGQLGEHNAIAVYPGEQAFQTFLKILKSEDLGPISPIEEMELAVSQDCLQLAFEDEFDLVEGELEEIRAFKRANKIRVGGDRPHPVLRTYHPNRLPKPMTDPNEMSTLKQAVEATIYVAGLTKKELAPFLTPNNLEPGQQNPLLIKDGSSFRVKDNITIPALEKKVYEKVVVSNTFLLGQLKKMLKKGPKQNLECELVLFPEPVMVDDDPEPVFPYCLFSVDANTGMALPPILSNDFLKHPDEILNQLLKNWIHQNTKPGSIVVPNERTYVLLLDTCEKLGIKIKQGPTPELDEFEVSFLSQMHDDDSSSELEEFIEFILNASPKDLEDLPEEILEQLEFLIEMEALPPEVTDPIERRIEQIRQWGRTKK